MRSFLFAFVALSAVACGDPCQKASDRTLAALEACGVDTTATDDAADDVEVECTEALQTMSECMADCAEAADCGAFDGSNADALTAYGECTAACAGA